MHRLTYFGPKRTAYDRRGQSISSHRSSVPETKARSPRRKEYDDQETLDDETVHLLYFLCGEDVSTSARLCGSASDRQQAFSCRTVGFDPNQENDLADDQQEDEGRPCFDTIGCA